MKKSSLSGTVSNRTGEEIQIENLSLYHKTVDVLERFDQGVSDFRKERREQQQATQAQA